MPALNPPSRQKRQLITWNELKISTPILASVFLLGTFIEPFIGHVAVGIFFMIAIAVSGLFFARITIFSLASLLILIYYYWLFPPDEPKDVPTVVALFIAAVSIGGLVNQLKNQANALHLREQATQLLYTLARELAQAQSRDDVAQISCTSMSSLFEQNVALAFISFNESAPASLEWHPASQFQAQATETQELLETFQDEKSTRDFALYKTHSGRVYLPLIGRDGLVGILLVANSNLLEKSEDKQRHAAMSAHQIAVAIERENFQARSRTVEVMERTQKLYKTLLNSVSHELKTPLVAITGSSSALMDDTTSRDPQLVQNLAAEILTASKRLRSVVENLLDMSRIDSGMLKPRREYCDVRDLLAVVVQRLELEGYPQSIRLDFQKDIPEIWVDPVLVDQALANIIHNARVYTPKGTFIEISVRASQDCAYISVRDHGPGLAEPGKVFEKFYRGSPQNPGGLGLGLSIAQGFIEAQGGHIEAANHPEGGAMFTITLPCHQQALPS
ncbi:MAG TPA: ATP-binding protein [Oligoflexus sp.]|uniref:sensor histidine kinase n=1 Tax=Oligoflexus sp. TaxID=1971216 RepID=UPI002D7E5912|nr:ATP-binding protein [Oligoflexus sp.]HET9239891.1 ATP-binding protein [Oligoflexus sp.]